MTRPLTPARFSWAPADPTPGPGSHYPPLEGLVRPKSTGGLGVSASLMSSQFGGTQLTVSSSLTSRAYSHTLSSRTKKASMDAKRAASPLLTAANPLSRSLASLESASSLSRATTAVGDLRQ